MVVVVVVRIDVDVLSVVGFLVGLLLGLRVGRLFPEAGLVTLAVVVRLGRGVVDLVPGLLVGLREGRGRLVVVVVVVDGAGACFFLFLFVFFPPVDPNRSPNISSPRRLKPV